MLVDRVDGCQLNKAAAAALPLPFNLAGHRNISNPDEVADDISLAAAGVTQSAFQSGHLHTPCGTARLDDAKKSCVDVNSCCTIPTAGHLFCLLVVVCAIQDAAPCSGELLEAIKAKWGSLDNFISTFNTTTAAVQVRASSGNTATQRLLEGPCSCWSQQHRHAL